MSKPMADTPKRRFRRRFTDEFEASAVRLVLDEGKTVGAAARDLDLTEPRCANGCDARDCGARHSRRRGCGVWPAVLSVWF